VPVQDHHSLGGVYAQRLNYTGTLALWRFEYTEFWLGNLRERDHLEDPSVDGRIILRWIFRKWKVAGTCECDNEPSLSIQCGEFLD
jgi:hypothetical protein